MSDVLTSREFAGSTRGGRRLTRRDERVAPRSAAQWAVAAALVAAAAAALLAEHALRVWETTIAAWLVGATFASETMVASAGDSPVIGFTAGQGWYAGEVTFAASSTLFLAVFAIGVALSALLLRASWRLALIATLAGFVVVVAANQGRLLLECLAFADGAQPGMRALGGPWGITVMVAVVAAALAAAVYVIHLRSAARRH